MPTSVPKPSSNPAFEARPLLSASGWYVRVAWLSGKRDHVPGFVSKREAQHWIEEKAPTWLSAHSKANGFDGAHMAQERRDLEISCLYFNVAIECFNKAAIEEHADGAEVFRRMGRRYISEAELYDATLKRKLAGRFASPQLWRRIGASSRARGRSIVSHRLAQ